jgi:hypothetical protein
MHNRERALLDKGSQVRLQPRVAVHRPTRPEHERFDRNPQRPLLRLVTAAVGLRYGTEPCLLKGLSQRGATRRLRRQLTGCKRGDARFGGASGVQLREHSTCVHFSRACFERSVQGRQLWQWHRARTVISSRIGVRIDASTLSAGDGCVEPAAAHAPSRL